MDQVVIHVEGPISSRLSGATVRLEFSSGGERFRLALSINDMLVTYQDMGKVVQQWSDGRAKVVKIKKR